jgi:hypothetical protein
MNPHDLQLEMICPNMRAMIFKAEMNQMWSLICMWQFAFSPEIL